MKIFSPEDVQLLLDLGPFLLVQLGFLIYWSMKNTSKTVEKK